MSRRVLKWPVGVDDIEHTIGKGPIVHVDVQNNDPRVVMVWTLECELIHGNAVNHVCRVFGTGHEIPPGWQHAGTAQALGGQLVWHVFTREAHA